MTGAPALAQQTTELLQQLIRNAAVNDGTPDSGQEWRQVRTLQEFFAGRGSRVSSSSPTRGGSR